MLLQSGHLDDRGALESAVVQPLKSFALARIPRIGRDPTKRKGPRRRGRQLVVQAPGPFGADSPGFIVDYHAKVVGLTGGIKGDWLGRRAVVEDEEPFGYLDDPACEDRVFPLDADHAAEDPDDTLLQVVTGHQHLGPRPLRVQDPRADIRRNLCLAALLWLRPEDGLVREVPIFSALKAWPRMARW